MRIPTSTYRLQLRAEFGFADAEAVVPYLVRLGVGDVYASPMLASVAGSAHGYDGVDPTRIDDERGGEAAFRSLGAAAHAAGLGLLVDIVPNHLATSEQNPWWWDVLRRGRDSGHAAAFDIEWDAPGLDGKVLLPVLGGRLDEILARGELTVDRDDPRGPVLRYWDRALPLAEGADAGEPGALVGRQHYELADWHEGPRRINYRRFFDITDLVSLHQEDPEVFARSHAKILELVAEGVVTGLRIDHVDGLADPAGYLEQLAAAAPGTYVVVEKILAADEALPSDWRCAGTTGYEALDAIGDVFVDGAGAAALEALFARVTDMTAPFSDIALGAKREVLADSFPADIEAVARRLPERGPGDAEAIAEITAQLDVYRTYGGKGEPFSPGDRARVEAAIERARAHVPAEALERVGAVLLEGSSPAVRRWQQLSGPAAAKGVEDTAIYRFPALVSRDEVGADPGTAPVSIGALHRLFARRAETWPGALTPLTTHDTKRGEDTRARVGVLASLATQYGEVVERLLDHHDDARRVVGGRPAPSRTDELLLYQNLLGAWPLDPAEDDAFEERILDYMAKAAHEEKLRTSWTDPDERYESELARFAQAAIETFRSDAVHGLRELRDSVAWYGALDGLAQTLVRLTAPGVPDTYQGCELWNLSLVDPDNRRPVDYALRSRLLDELAIEAPPRAEVARDALARWRDGRIKLLVTARTLRLRRDRPELFESGTYTPVPVAGPRARHAFGYVRGAGAARCVALVARLPALLAPVGTPPLGREAWGDTAVALPASAPTRWRDAFTGATVEANGDRIPLAEVFSTLPLALLVSDG